MMRWDRGSGIPSLLAGCFPSKRTPPTKGSLACHVCGRFQDQEAWGVIGRRGKIQIKELLFRIEPLDLGKEHAIESVQFLAARRDDAFRRAGARSDSMSTLQRERAPRGRHVPALLAMTRFFTLLAMTAFLRKGMGCSRGKRRRSDQWEPKEGEVTEGNLGFPLFVYRS